MEQPSEEFGNGRAPCAQPPLSKLGRGGSCLGPGPTDFLSQCRLWQQPGIGRRWQTTGVERQWVAPPTGNWKWVVGVKVKRSGSVLASQLQQSYSVPEFKPGPVYKRPSCPSNTSSARPLPIPHQHLRGPEEAGRTPQAWGSRGAGGVHVLISHLLLRDLSGFPPWNVSCGRAAHTEAEQLPRSETMLSTALSVSERTF